MSSESSAVGLKELCAFFEKYGSFDQWIDDDWITYNCPNAPSNENPMPFVFVKGIWFQESWFCQKGSYIGRRPD